MKIGNKLLVGAALIVVLVSIAIHYLSGSLNLFFLFNADSLYLPTLFENILAQNGRLNDWYLTPAPYFFPDYPLFLVAYLMGGAFYEQILLFALLQVLITFLVIWLLSRVISQKNSALVALVISIGLVWLALRLGEPFSLLFHSAYHYGVFIVAILLSALWLQWQQQQQQPVLGRQIADKAWLLLMAGIAFVTGLSDNLFLVQFLVPFLATQFLFLQRSQSTGLEQSWQAMRPTLLIVLAGLLGSLSYRWVVEHRTRYSVKVGFENIITNVQTVFDILLAPLLSSIFYAVIVVFYIIAVIYAFYKVYRGDKNNVKLYWLTIFSFFSIGATLSTLILMSNLPITNRYLIAAFSWPLLVIILWLNYLYVQRLVFLGLIGISLLASISWSSYQVFSRKDLNYSFYPAEIACIDKALEQQSLNKGVAQYWDAKVVQELSRLDLRIAQYLADSREFRWITSEKYFDHRYDFAIVTTANQPPFKISLEQLQHLNGLPQQIVDCGTKSVLIYGKDQLRMKKIAQIGDSYTWLGCELPTSVGIQAGSCAMQKQDNAAVGYLTFGPLELLGNGEYRFELEYSSMAIDSVNVGIWDLVLAHKHKAVELKQGEISGSRNATKKISESFTLNSKRGEEKIEIRTFSHPGFDLVVHSLRIERAH